MKKVMAIGVIGIEYIVVIMITIIVIIVVYAKPMKHEPCRKCGSTKRPSRHHVLPKFFFGGRGGLCSLCTKCHREIEAIIHAQETKYSGTKSQRFNLGENTYREILRRFLLGDTVD